MRRDVSGSPFALLEHATTPANTGGCAAKVARILPIIRWLPCYNVRASLAYDVAGGLTLGVVLMAHSVAHAWLSKVYLVHGPYSCVVAPLVYMIFGSSRHGSVGTGSLVALLTGEHLRRYDSEDFRTAAASTLALLVGLMLIFMGALRLSGIVRFMSRPALSGFITGSALLVMAAQVPGAIGLRHGQQTPVHMVADVLAGQHRVEVHSAVLSVCVLVVLFGLQFAKQYSKVLEKVSAFKELLVLVASTAFVALKGADIDVTVVGKLPVGLPSASAPSLDRDLVMELLPTAFLIAVMVFVSSFAVAKQFGMKAGYPVNAMNELLGLGFANAVGSLFGCLPTQISLSRTSIAYSSGATSQVGTSCVTASMIALALMVFTPLFYYMPRCALHCVIIVAAGDVCDFGQIQALYRLAVTWRDLKDLFVWLTAFLAVVLLGALRGMLVAMVVSLVLLVLEVSEPNLAVLQPIGTRWRSGGHLDSQHDEGILVVRLDGALFYANAESFQDQVENLEQALRRRGEVVHSVILDFSCIPFVDSTVVEVLQEMMGAWERRRVTVRIAGAVGRVIKVLENEFKARIGQDNFVVSVQDAYEELVRMSYRPPRLESSCKS